MRTILIRLNSNGKQKSSNKNSKSAAKEGKAPTHARCASDYETTDSFGLIHLSKRFESGCVMNRTGQSVREKRRFDEGSSEMEEKKTVAIDDFFVEPKQKTMATYLNASRFELINRAIFTKAGER